MTFCLSPVRLISLLALGLIALGNQSWAQPYTWPIQDSDDRSKLTRDYAHFVSTSATGSDSAYHAGIDISATTSTLVYPVAEGVVAKIYATGAVKNELEKAGFILNNDEVAEHAKQDNHCMGNVIIIDHGTVQPQEARYSLYAHLHTILSTIPHQGQFISIATPIGTAGETGFDSTSRPICSGSGVHLHLELKTQAVLHNPTNPLRWGYAADHPDELGYSDPLIQLHPFNRYRFPPLMRIVEQDDELLVGPGGAGLTSYRAIGTVERNTIVRAWGVAPPVSSHPSVCTQSAWIQVTPLSESQLRGFRDRNRGGFVADGWKCNRNVLIGSNGDLNVDGRVDVLDLGILLSSWGRQDRPVADIDQDGKVNVVDLGILLSNWTRAE